MIEASHEPFDGRLTICERMYVRWSTIGGITYRGYVTEVDSNVLYVRCQDGVERCVEDFESVVTLISEEEYLGN